MAGPSALSLYPRVIGGALRLALPGGSRPSELPERELTLEDVVVDRDHLAAYDRVCTYPIGDGLPVTYPHLLAFPLSLKLMAAGDFPFPALGLVHVANRIEQRRGIGAGEPLSVRVWAEGLRAHARGRQFDIVAAVSVDGEEVWRSASTYLRRVGGGAGDGGKGKRREGSDDGEHPAAWTFSVGSDIGRRYGAVSGDRNPIHLHPLSAKAFGMPGAIAHGMWLQARALAILDDHVPDACTVAVDFKLPVRLPARVALAAWADGPNRAFAVTDARTSNPHLRGTIS